MPAKAAPPKDSFAIQPDGTIVIAVKGEAIELRVPTIGELKKLEGVRQQVLVELEPVTARLQAIHDEALASATEGAAATLSNEATAELRELTQLQREAFGSFWAGTAIPTLGGAAVVADDLPAFMGHGVTMGRAFRAWESSPPDPGAG